MNQLWANEIEEPIKNELIRRANVLTLDPNVANDKYIKWQQKTPWISIFSNVKTYSHGDTVHKLKPIFDDDGNLLWERDLAIDFDDKLAKANVFTGLMSTSEGIRETFEDIYKSDENDTHKLRPVPTLESLSIENIDDKGAVRKATFKFSCYTLKQLEDMEILYMSPGATLYIQWGWNVIVSNIEEVSFADKNKEDEDGLQNYEERKKRIDRSGGNYGSLLGTIDKFDWSVNEDGSFACSTEIVSRGYVDLFNKVQESHIQIDKESSDATIIDIFKEMKDSHDEIKVNGDGSITENAVVTKLKTRFKSPGKLGNGVNNFGQLFIDIRFLFNLINLFYGGNSPFLNEKSGEPILIGDRKTAPILRSLDRTAFLIPRGGKLQDAHIQAKFPETWGDIIGTMASSRGGPAIWTDDVNLIYVGVDLCISSFTSANTYSDGVTNILNQLNSNTYGYWDLALVITEEGNISIIDKNLDYTQKGQKPWNECIFWFPSMGVNSMTQNVSLSAVLPDAIKNAAAYSGVGNSSSKVQGGFGNLWSEMRDDVNASFGGITKLAPIAEKNTAHIAELWQEAVQKSRSTEFITQAKIPDRYRAYLAKLWAKPNKQEENSKYVSAVLLPLSLSITIDGIEGLAFGNAVGIDYLPERYRSNSYFTIFNISHEISADGWTTTLETKFRVGAKRVLIPKPKQYSVTEVAELKEKYFPKD